MSKYISINDVSDKLFQQRLEKNVGSIFEKYSTLYGGKESLFNQLIKKIKDAFADRKIELKEKDMERELNPSWFLAHNIVAMSLYIDLFSDTLNNLMGKINYLKELGINLIHFMPLLKTRDGNDDGGFAVSSYTQIKPKFGTMEDFEKLNDMLRNEGISTCIDFVANHTAQEHDWARRAIAGEKKYQEMYYMYDTYDIPAEFEKTLPNEFPELAPGNFTYHDGLKKWIFTTFYEFQWDLNYKNPLTLNNMVKQMLFLLNKGVDVVRVDAIRHIWKEVGTTCSNLPQTHLIVEIMKTIANIVCPGVVFLGEAITSQKDVLEYFGAKEKGCELMYNVTLMSSLWSSLATRDVRYMSLCMQNTPTLPEGVCWVNYIRCHDDVEFILEESEIKSFNLAPFTHSQFMINFYKGDFPSSFSQGELYSYDEKTKNARISGTLASMCGLEKGLKQSDKLQIDYACRKILLLYGVLLSYSGIPIIYSGDEIATLNNYDYKKDPEKMADSRWLHRVKFDWIRANLRNNTSTPEGPVFQGLKKLLHIKKNNPIFSAKIKTSVFDTLNYGVLGCFKQSEKELFLLIANFTEHHQTIDTDAFRRIDFGGTFTDLINDNTLNLNTSVLRLNPYEFFWLRQQMEE